MKTKNLSHLRILKIEDVQLVILHNGEFAFEIPTNMSTARFLRFKKTYSEEISNFKNLS